MNLHLASQHGLWWSAQEAFFTGDPKRARDPVLQEVYDLKLAGGHNLYVANNFIVGNSGKTEAGAVEAYWFMSGTHPHKKDIPIPNVGRILAESLEHFENDILPKFKRWAPNFAAWKPIKGHQGKIAGYELPNGSVFHVFTFQQEYGKLEGTNFYWCWANEPPPQSHVNASLRGLVDQGGYFWFTLTPLSEPYLYNEFYLPAVTGKRNDIGIHTASIHDNPWLDDAGKSLLLANIDADERLSRELGQFKHLIGRVFKDFDPNQHVIPKKEHPDWPGTWPVTIGIDPHLRKQHVAVILGWSRKGWYIALDEIATSKDLEEFGWEIVRTVREAGYEVSSICADSIVSQPDMVRRDIEPKQVLDQIFFEAGLPRITIASKRDTNYGFRAEMKRLLKSQLWPIGNLEGPGFYVMDTCPGLIKDFMNYTYRESKRPEISGPSEEPIKRWDDYLDALKYAFLADPSFESKFKIKPSALMQTYTGRYTAR
jgi:hypothetical protein